MRHSPSAFTRWFVTLTFVGVLIGCGDSEEPSPDAGTPDTGVRDSGVPDSGPSVTLTPFETYREVLSVVRESPDHLIARAEQLVAAKDEQGLFSLVRDDIATYPPAADRLDDMVGAMRWGPRAALRGGAGTPREKAEILASLYTQAGLSAEVVEGTLVSSIELSSLFLRAPDPQLALNASAEQLEQWQAALGRTIEDSPRAPYEGSESDTMALADQLAALAPGAAPFEFTPGPVPLVRVTVDGTARYANPLVPDGVFGESYTEAEPVTAGPAGELQRLTVRLEGAKVESPFSPAVLVEHTWSAEEVVGRRIFAGFMPLLTPAGFASARTDQIDVVVPTLSLQSFDLTKSELADLSALGKPISRGGSVFEVGPDGSVSVDGASLGAGPTDPADLARVERVVPAANPVLFPRVRLSVKAEDATGLGVSRLGSDAFHVREDGEPKSFILRRNIAAPPRLLLLFDNSDSIPAEFRGAERVAMGADIASQLFALEPNAEVRVATVDFGISFQGSWAQSVADVQTQLESIAGTGSDLWYALEGAMEAEPTVVVLVTDGVASDVLEPSTRLRIAGHAPVVVLAVGAVDPVTVERIVDLTGGVAHFPGDGVAASGLVLDEIRARQSVHYELEYSSAATRSSTVTVQVDVGSQSGTTTFVAPTVSTPASRFSGLWITIETGGRQVRRKLAGHDGPVVIPPPLIDDAVLSDVEGALLSSTEIRVEGAPPPASVWLEEWLEHVLEKEPMFDAFLDDDAAAFLPALGRRTLPMDPTLLQMLSRTHDRASADHLTFETGLSIASVTRRPVLGDGRFIISDVFPLSAWSTASLSPETAYRRTLEYTTRRMRIEGARRTRSVESELDGVPLVLVHPNDVDADLAGLPVEARERWRRFLAQFADGQHVALVPESGTPEVFWLADQRGTVIGVHGPDSAGWTESYERDREAINQAFGVGSIFLDAEAGAWAELERLKLIMLSFATQAIDNGMISVEELLEELGCAVFNSSGILDPIPGANDFVTQTGQIRAALDGTSSILGGPPVVPESPIPCF